MRIPACATKRRRGPGRSSRRPCKSKTRPIHSRLPALPAGPGDPEVPKRPPRSLLRLVARVRGPGTRVRRIASPMRATAMAHRPVTNRPAISPRGKLPRLAAAGAVAAGGGAAGVARARTQPRTQRPATRRRPSNRRSTWMPNRERSSGRPGRSNGPRAKALPQDRAPRAVGGAADGGAGVRPRALLAILAMSRSAAPVRPKRPIPDRRPPKPKPA